jgi:signal transduction histidine kinase
VARAEPRLDLAALDGGVRVTPGALWLRDPTGRLDLADVQRADVLARFQPTLGELSLGLDSAALWLHVRARNSAPRHKSWMLELAYPHLDNVTLYVVRKHGPQEQYLTGDMRPFAERPVAHPNFIFPLEAGPGEEFDLFLRVATTGTLSVPLRAWNVPELMAHQSGVNTALLLLMGGLLMMATYNTAVFTLIRQSEYLFQAALITSMAAVVFAYSGLMFQYALPHHPAIANKSIWLFVMLSASASAFTAAKVASGVEGHAMYERIARNAGVFALVQTLLVALLPKELGVRLASAIVAVFVVVGTAGNLYVKRRVHAQLHLYLRSWYFPVAGMSLTLLVNFGLLPPWPMLSAAGYVGCAIQAVFTSLALAARVKIMGDDLAALNGQLSSNVVSLKGALESAERANETAQQATRAKDEFVATMSHELRTPLNAIINVPQGLLEDFVDVRGALCRACGTRYVLEATEELGPQTPCPDCAVLGSLQRSHGVEFVGNAEKTRHYLRKLERAGKHLLQLVDGVLDFSKLEAGRLVLHVSRVDLGELLRDVADAMSEPARLRQLTVKVDAPSLALICEADPFRLRQVLLNLVSNAIKFSEAGGDVVLELKDVAETDTAMITIRDRGIGIAPEHHERIFAGFEQVHQGNNRKYGGTGLGLPISRNLVRLHGGELSVESSLGAGSSFIVRLPKTQRPVAPIDYASVPGSVTESA